MKVIFECMMLEDDNVGHDEGDVEHCPGAGGAWVGSGVLASL